MKLLFVLSVDPWTRCAATIERYVAAGRAAGHEVAVFGDPNPELPGIAFTTDITGVDLAVFVVQIVEDIPQMPALARLIDRIPRERDGSLSICGADSNDTVRVEHDFNHLEKLDGHQAWEWQEAVHSISDRVLQPTLRRRRPGSARSCSTRSIRRRSWAVCGQRRTLPQHGRERRIRRNAPMAPPMSAVTGIGGPVFATS